MNLILDTLKRGSGYRAIGNRTHLELRNSGKGGSVPEFLCSKFDAFPHRKRVIPPSASLQALRLCVKIFRSKAKTAF
jgi:hypothetical protein